jgi:hypothetical protein
MKFDSLFLRCLGVHLQRLDACGNETFATKRDFAEALARPELPPETEASFDRHNSDYKRTSPEDTLLSTFTDKGPSMRLSEDALAAFRLARVLLGCTWVSTAPSLSAALE